jgi:predicted nucleic acid-binding protein
MKRYVIDSYAMMAYFEDEPGAEAVAEILSAIINKKSKGYMSIINWGEIYYNVYRIQGENVAEKVLLQLTRYAIEFVDADRSLTHEAAKLKGKHKIAYADCFAAALANELNARVVTGDPEFKKLETEVAIEWVV